MHFPRGHHQVLGAVSQRKAPRGHAHFWERALSRGTFINTAAGAAGAALGASLWRPGSADAAFFRNPAPKPIPGGFQLSPGGPVFHVSGGPGAEPSSITDLLGIVGIAMIQGTGTGTDTATGATIPLLFDSDMRFMVGEYVAVDGRTYQGTFGFV